MFTCPLCFRRKEPMLHAGTLSCPVFTWYMVLVPNTYVQQTADRCTTSAASVTYAAPGASLLL